jgi:S1-C subfamily serine protease
MSIDLNMALMRATFKLEQRQEDGVSTVGTGWLVRLPGPGYGGGKDRVALVTAGHVFDRMKKSVATIHWRREDDSGNWHRESKPLTIRDEAVAPKWTRHNSRDIAVMLVTPPDQPRAHAIDFELLADDSVFREFDVRPGDEVLALGYPRGIAANELGFPILRSGRVASFPLWPSQDFPTFLMDFAVFAGNSGGPVYMADRSRKAAGAKDFHEAQFIAGMLIQQVTLTDERLEIGIVLHATFVREALLELMANAQSPPRLA